MARTRLGKKVFQMFICQVRIPYIDENGWSGVKDYPSFFIHPELQGLTTEAQVKRFLQQSFGEGYYNIQLVDMLSGGSLVYSAP